jgi:general secretion pathway protein J
MIPSPRARGFTLIEVLVALALMSLIGTILIESLRVAGHTWQRVTREAGNIDEITRAQDFLRQRLAAVQPPKPAGGSDSSAESFLGQADRLEFSSVSPGAAHGGLVRYSLGLSQSEPANVDLGYRPLRHGLSPTPAAEDATEPLIAHATGLSIQYWENATGSSGHWVDQWTDTSQLPKLIRIEIRFAASDSRRWPPLYVEPRIDTRASCVFDVVGRRCRAAE